VLGDLVKETKVDAGKQKNFCIVIEGRKLGKEMVGIKLYSIFQGFRDVVVEIGAVFSIPRNVGMSNASKL
jgi:hypothetical protein